MSRSAFIEIDLNFLETHEEMMSLANDYLTKIGSTKWCFLIREQTSNYYLINQLWVELAVTFMCKQNLHAAIQGKHLYTNVAFPYSECFHQQK